MSHTVAVIVAIANNIGVAIANNIDIATAAESTKVFPPDFASVDPATVLYQVLYRTELTVLNCY